MTSESESVTPGGPARRGPHWQPEAQPHTECHSLGLGAARRAAASELQWRRTVRPLNGKLANAEASGRPSPASESS